MDFGLICLTQFFVKLPRFPLLIVFCAKDVLLNSHAGSKMEILYLPVYVAIDLSDIFCIVNIKISNFFIKMHLIAIFLNRKINFIKRKFILKIML